MPPETNNKGGAEPGPNFFINVPVRQPDCESPEFIQFQQENSANPKFVPEKYRFELDRRLGSGGSGAVVCEAIEKETNKIYACKIDNVFVEDPKTKAHKMQEPRIHRQIGVAPNIVDFYGCHVSNDGTSRIFMERMSTSVDKLLAKVGQIPENHLSNIALAVLSAMDSLFRQDKPVIHRDIKPDNIFVDSCGAVKVGDFSVSRQLNIDSIATTCIGTRKYMSPERILFVREKWLAAMTSAEAARLANVAGDVWSLGMTLMELALGRFPMPKMTRNEQRAWMNADKTDRARLLSTVPNIHLKGDIQYANELKADPPVSDLCDDFSDSFKSFVKACLQEDFSKRPQLQQLLEMDFIRRASDNADPFADWIKDIVRKCQF